MCKKSVFPLQVKRVFRKGSSTLNLRDSIYNYIVIGGAARNMWVKPLLSRNFQGWKTLILELLGTLQVSFYSIQVCGCSLLHEFLTHTNQPVTSKILSSKPWLWGIRTIIKVQICTTIQDKEKTHIRDNNKHKETNKTKQQRHWPVPYYRD